MGVGGSGRKEARRGMQRQSARHRARRGRAAACMAAKRGWRGGDGWLAHLPLALLSGCGSDIEMARPTASLLSVLDAHSLHVDGLQLQLHVSPRALAVGIGRQCRGAGGASVLSFCPQPAHGYTNEPTSPSFCGEAEAISSSPFTPIAYTSGRHPECWRESRH
jgi:hypothetical protein